MKSVKKISAILIIAAAIFFAWIPGGRCARTGPVPILVLGSHNVAPYTDVADGFERALTKLGINAAIEKYWLEGESDSKLAEALERAGNGGFGAILTLGSAATSATGEKVGDTPVVAGLILDADDLKDRRNTVGVLLDFPPEVEFEWIKRIVPSGKNVGLPANAYLNTL